MTIKECVLNNFAKYFKNCGIPCNELLVASIKEHIGVEAEVVERNSYIIVVKLLFSDEPMKIKGIFRESENVLKYIVRLEVIE